MTIRTPPLHPHTGEALTSHLTSICHQAHCVASIPAFTTLRPPSHLSVLTPRVTSDGPNLPSPQTLSPPPRSSLVLVAVSTPHYKSDGSLSASHQAVGGSRLHADLRQSISLPRRYKEVAKFKSECLGQMIYCRRAKDLAMKRTQM